MTAANHHPEDLIDRARRGALAPDQRSILDRHLATCAACAAHLAQAPLFAQELGPQSRDELLDRRAVEAAMARMQRPAPALRSHAWPRWLRFAAAGLLLASGATAAATIVSRKLSAGAQVVAPVPVPAQPPAVRAPPAAALPVPPPAALPAEAPAVAERPHPSAPPPRSAAAARPAVSAGELFERAGKLRREGHAVAAIAAYRRLQETFPNAREAQLSFALAGQLLLERGRPGDALAQFDHPSKAGGDVGEERLAGRAAALEQLKRTDEAIAAWKSLLDRYPGSVYAARARTRLAQLAERR